MKCDFNSIVRQHFNRQVAVVFYSINNSNKKTCSERLPTPRCVSCCQVVVGHLYAFTPLPKRVFLGPRKQFKGRLKIPWDKNFYSQSPPHYVENLMSIGLQVASESSSEGMLSVCLSVCIKSNITRKRFDAGYSNLEHWSYLMPCSPVPSDRI